MQSIITSFLLQTNYCALPQIGVFETTYKHAGNDILNMQLIPPSQPVNFKQETRLASSELIHFIAFKKNISVVEAESQLNIFCNEWKQKIDAGETLYFNTFGALKKNEQDEVILTEDSNHAYLRPVSAVKILHTDVKENVLVNEDQAASATDNYYTVEVEKKKELWAVWAIIFAVIALSILLYHFYKHKSSTSSIGNQSKVIIKPAPETYVVPSK